MPRLGGPCLVPLTSWPAVVRPATRQVDDVLQEIRERVDGPKTAIAYGVLNTIAKWANLAGQAGYLRDRRRGRMARLIEYKRVGEGQGAPAPEPVVPADARP